MTFVQAIGTGFRKYGEFQGRARRSEFWWWALFTVLVGSALSALSAWTVQLADGGTIIGPTLGGFWSIAVLLPTLAMQVRRLRDAGYGWGHMFWGLLPVAGLVVLVVLWAQPSRERMTAPHPTAPIPQPAGL